MTAEFKTMQGTFVNLTQSDIRDIILARVTESISDKTTVTETILSEKFNVKPPTYQICRLVFVDDPCTNRTIAKHARPETHLTLPSWLQSTQNESVKMRGSRLTSLEAHTKKKPTHNKRNVSMSVVEHRTVYFATQISD